MNDINYQSAVKEATKAKFKGHKTIKVRVIPRYPDTAERELQRIHRGYIRLLNKSLKEHLPEIMDAYKQEIRKDSREDSVGDFRDKIHRMVMKIAAELEDALEQYEIDKAIKRIAGLAQNSNIREWKRLVKRSLGIDILTDYYKGETYEQLIGQWVSENISRVKSMPTECLLNLQEIIAEGYQEGKLIGEIREEIQEEYNLTKRRAELLARDQISTLNSELTEMQQRDAGVTKYRWSSSRDSRVRECHQEFDGNIFNWDDPPEAWYSTKSRGIVYTGRKCNPGEDYCCRCVAIPVFEWETVNLPMKG